MEKIPLDKSWIIRMGFLDIINEYGDIAIFLDTQKNLNDDLLALKRVAETWKLEKKINVGESGTIYRFFKFASWKLKLGKEFVLEGTLKDRKICDDSSIVSWPLEKLLELDNGTSQWASAAILMGDETRISNPPYKLKVTHDAVDHWKSQRAKNESWLPRYDNTILRQSEVYLKMCKGEAFGFIPEQAEDYCFARIFGLISKEEGEGKWPALRGHESDRIAEMEVVIQQIERGEQIASKDHRVVQAVGMYQKLNNIDSTVMYPTSVNKSWPQFWEFINTQ
jgi:hypothetical protein